MENIILYTTGCPRCAVLKKKMDAKHITYSQVHDEDLMIAKGFMTVPILEVDGVCMEFSEANKWISQHEN